MRLIDADALKEAIEEYFDGVCVYDVAPSQAVNDFQDVVDSMTTVEPMQWIPCEVRLPEEDKDVLICYQCKEGEGDTSHAYIDITSYGQAYFGGRKCSFKEWRALFAYFNANYEVVAWMPLPAPYKDGDADGKSD